jgi:ketosteroid isomerase-like protein
MAGPLRLTALAALSLAAAAAIASPAGSLDSLVAAERSFSATSVEKGMREAFLTFLADDGTIFRPYAMNGKEVWQARRPSPATLIWDPSYAEVSAGGDLGITTGPWEFRPPADSTGVVAPERIGHGHFVTAWRRQADGSWRVAADMGTSHDKPAFGGLGKDTLTAGPEHSHMSKPDPNAKGIEDAEEGFSKLAQARGIASAASKWVTDDVRWNRDGEQPAWGPAAARAMAAKDEGTVRLTPQYRHAAGSGDLGYAYGLAERFASKEAKSPADSAMYLHVWRKEGGLWRLSLAVVNPIRR